LSLSSEEPLVDGIVRWWQARIDDRIVRPGTRLPSIRGFAADKRVSRHTVVEAYERLTELGYVEARRGSGFYVRARAAPAPAPRSSRAAPAPDSRIDVAWLLRSMFRDLPHDRMPGGGLFPPDWLDSALIAQSARGVTRTAKRSWLAYGTPQGYLPLRQQLSLKLSALEIPAEPEQIVTTAGVTHAIDLVARHFLRPGDAVFVDDPAWFVMFARFAMLGARVIGVPRRADGPDLEALRGLLVAHRPKVFVLSSVLHNPTGTSMTAANAYAVLQLAEEHGVTLVEDDIYGDLSPDATPHPPARLAALRLAALDRRRRVIYVGGFSKTLAANLRVGYLVAPPELALALADQKLLGALTTPEFGERVIARVLIERRYARHCAGLRANLDAARTTVLARLRKLGAPRVRGGRAGHVPVGRSGHGHQCAGHPPVRCRLPGRARQPLLPEPAPVHLDALQRGVVAEPGDVAGAPESARVASTSAAESPSHRPIRRRADLANVRPSVPRGKLCCGDGASIDPRQRPCSYAIISRRRTLGRWPRLRVENPEEQEEP
jgi:DNA-binding transcriptional MocR family regulator